MCGYVSLLVSLVLRNKTKNHKKAAKKKELLFFILYAAFPFPVVSLLFTGFFKGCVLYLRLRDTTSKALKEKDKYAFYIL